jgi:hypothetical protein
MPQYIFLSYGRRDVYPKDAASAVAQAQYYPLVEKVYHHLHALRTQLGMEPWLDKQCLTSDRPFTDSINEAVEQSTYMLLFIGKHAIQSEWCKREWTHALKHCVSIIPVLLEGKWEDDDIQRTYPARISSTDGINPQRGDGTLDENFLLSEITRKLGMTPAPLTVALNARKLPDHYIEREGYLDKLKAKLEVNDRRYTGRANIVGITSEQEVAALQGIGGIGKTTLALALCADCDVRRNFDHLFWLDVGSNRTADDVPALMYVIGAHFKDAADNYKDVQVARAQLQTHLRGKRTLVVLDDVWEDGIVSEFSLANIDLRLLVTTRQKTLIEDSQPVSKLSPEEGARLLATLFDARNPKPEALSDTHRAIVQMLDGYTLALEIAGKWLKKISAPARGVSAPFAGGRK